MGRKNEIKKDIWNILREVYCIHEEREITDKQNEFLDKVIAYLDENISLRRKVVKDKPEQEEEIPFEPLLRPEPVKKTEPAVPVKVEPVKRRGTPPPAKTTNTAKPAVVASAAPSINASALPEHLRKYLKK